MKILVIGASGTVGRAVVAALQGRHEILEASHGKSRFKVNLEKPDSIHALFEAAGVVDAVVCAAGEARFAPLAKLTEADFEVGLRSKLMGQVNLARAAIGRVATGGSITLTAGILSHRPMPGSAAISLVNAGIEGFVRAAALDSQRDIRVNAVSPPWVSETLQAMGKDPEEGRPAADVAQLYVRAVEGSDNGRIIEF